MNSYRHAMKILLLLLALAIVAGCQREEPPPVTKLGKKKSLHVVVPAEVKAKWKAVRIVVFDKQERRDQIFTVDVDGWFVLPDTNLQVEVTNFLPSFVTDGKTATSTSNDPKNPGVELILRQDGEELTRGWLFKNATTSDPEKHQIFHPRYRFTLQEVVARR